MTRHLVADTHFGDPEPLGYADRPFGSVGAMNDALVERWNAVVSAGDEVIVVGDFAVPAEPTTLRRWLRRLAGDVVLVTGDHDDGARRCRPLDVRASYRLEAGGHRLTCVHDPGDDPPDREGWLVHGHHHDRPGEFPFVDPAGRRANVAVERTGYGPVAVDELVGYLDDDERLPSRPD